jgi:hypothetical protein
MKVARILRKTIIGRGLVLTLCLLIGLSAAAADMANWYTYFDGAAYGMGPYGWVDGATVLAKDPTLASVVKGGFVGTTVLYVCRSKGSDGTHPGKFFNGQCNIGWGGKEYAVTQPAGFDLLVNTQPTNAKYFPQVWVPYGTHEANQFGFFAGQVGTSGIRTCRAAHVDGTHLGKEWGGKCLIGWGGNEVAVTPYEVLNLKFDKEAWKAAGSPDPTVTTLVTSGANWAQGATIVFMSPNVTLSSNPIQIPPVNIDSTNYAQKMLDDFNTAYYTGVLTDWRPGALGVGLTGLAQRLPNLMYDIIDKYNAEQTDAAQKKDRTTMYNNLVAGNVDAQGFMVLAIVDRTKSILNRSQATWTVEETSLVNFMIALADDQRAKAAGTAKSAFEAWKVSDRENKTVGLLALTYVPSKPPGEFLAMARGGYAVASPAIANNMGRVITVAAGAAVATGAAIAFAATGVGATIASAASSVIAAGIALKGAAYGSIAAGGAVGAVVVVALMITAGIVKGVDLAEYDQYVKDFDAAYAAAKTHTTAAALQQDLSNTEGTKKVLYWLAAQAATGTAP